MASRRSSHHVGREILIATMLPMILSAPHVAYSQSDSATIRARSSVSTSTYVVHGDTVRWVPNTAIFLKMHHNPIDTLKFMFRGDSAVVFTPLGPKAVSPAFARTLRQGMQEADYSKCVQGQLAGASHSSPDLNICTPLIPLGRRSGLASSSKFIARGDTIRWIRTRGRPVREGEALGTSLELRADTTDFMFRGDSAVILRPHGPKAVSPFFASVLRKLMNSEAFTERLHQRFNSH